MTTLLKEREDVHAKNQARAQLASIKEMVDALNTDDDNAREEARESILEDALSVEIRSGWRVPGSKAKPEEYMILLCTGGPACRIIGQLGRYNTPETAQLQYQDWFTPWTDYGLTSEDEHILLQYAQCFYFED